MMRPIFSGFRVFLRQAQIIGLVLVMALLLTGCIQSEVSVRFDRQNKGEIVQALQLKQGVTGFSSTTTQPWLERIEQEGRRLGGTVEPLSAQSIQIRIPFYSSAELETKFNQFFNAELNHALFNQPNAAQNEGALPELASHLVVNHSNFLLVERDRLQYDVDLRSLGLLSVEGNLLVSPTQLIDLQFKLDTPWGANIRSNSNPIQPQIQHQGQTLIWTLTPGEQNHLDVQFWLPSPLGIGAVVIIVLVLVGQGLKSQYSVATIKGNSLNRSTDNTHP